MSAKTLNVIFAGPMIFLMENPQVRVLVPRVDGHQYTIDRAAAAATTYVLKGATGPGDAAQIRYELPRGADAFRLSASQLHLTLDLQKEPFFTFLLPAPNRVVALSSREADIIDAFGSRRMAVMPTSYVFVYDVSGAESLALDPNPGWNARNRVVQNQFTNLVVAGGLPGSGLDPMGYHARAAFSELTSYFPELKMQFLSAGQEIQSGEVQGLPKEFVHSSVSRGRNTEPPRLSAAVLNSTMPRARLVPATAIDDCQVGSVIVTKP